MAFPADPLDVKVELAIGADIHADPGTWAWTDVTTSIREKQKIQITRGRRNRIGNFPSTKVSATADNTDGNLCRHNPFGTHFGILKKNTPMRTSVNNGGGYITRGAVYVPGFPPSWDPSGVDQVVTLTGVGITDRLGRSKPLRSAMYRTMSGASADDYKPLAYLPLEDRSGATLLGAQTADTPSATITGDVSLASYSGATGSDSVPVLNTGGVIAGRFQSTTLVPTGFGDTVYQVQFMAMVPSSLSADATFLDFGVQPVGGDNIARLSVQWLHASTSLVLRWYNTSSALVGTATLDFAANPELFDVPTLYGLTVNTDVLGAPGTIDVAIDAYIDGSGTPAASASGTWSATTIRAPYSWQAAATAGNTGWSLSHLGLYTDPAVLTGSALQDNAGALDGHAGELAHVRAERLCREERVPFTTAATVSQAMGPQRANRLLDLLRECANTDQGLLYENMTFGLTFVSADERYNQTAAITLAYDDGEILPPWEPEDDDQEYFNDVTASRPGGGSYQASDEDDIADVGQYADAINPNVETDAQLQLVAGWRRSIGLNDELTWPAVRPNLMLGGVLLNAWLAADLGDQMWVTGHPAPLAPDTIKQIIEGYSETLGSYTCDVSATLSSATPWDVGVYGDDANAARYDGDAELASGVDDNDTSWSVTVDPPWITTATHPAEFPIRVTCGGLVYTVTAISGATSPQTWTVTRLAQDKAHLAGAPIRVYPSPIYGL